MIMIKIIPGTDVPKENAIFFVINNTTYTIKNSISNPIIKSILTPLVYFSND